MTQPDEILDKIIGYNSLVRNSDTTHAIVMEAMTEYGKVLITEFLDFLLENNYCDDDVWREPPTAIDRFYHPNLNK